MKRNRLFDSIVIVLLFAQTQVGFSQGIFTPDHGQHFVAGAVVGGVGALFSTRPILAGIVCGTGAGLAKEWHDSHYHGARFDGKDVVFTALGGIVSGVVVKQMRKTLFYKHKKKRKK